MFDATTTLDVNQLTGFESHTYDSSLDNMTDGLAVFKSRHGR